MEKLKVKQNKKKLKILQLESAEKLHRERMPSTEELVKLNQKYFDQTIDDQLQKMFSKRKSSL